MTKLIVQIAVVLLVGVLCLPLAPSADQAQYFYDELGRLVGVVDGQGNAAVYNYDAVGNLLSIDRFTAGATGIGIFLLAPSSGLVGTNVDIRGFGFSATASENQVAFSGTAATVVAASPTSILATVPAGATTGPVTVTKTTTNETATSPQPFTVVAITITGVVPARVAQGTTKVTVIQGTNLASATGVQFTQGGLSATLLSGATVQSLPINLAVAGTVPPGSYPFSVTTPFGTVPSGAVTVTVTPPEPSGVFGSLSVFLPFPAQVAPAGPSGGMAPPVSVLFP